jgi:two-component system, OmpR family, sensor kinase
VPGKDDIAALADQFNAMLDRLEQAFHTQRRFLDDASHELRTPITIIRGNLEFVEDDDPQERAEVVRLCTDELDRMSRIVEDLLLLAKLEHPTFLHRELVEVEPFTVEMQAKVRTLGDRTWVLDSVGVGPVHADPQRLTQAWMNLVRNAVEHTTPGDRITIGSAQDGHSLRLWVVDTGPGIDPADQEVIFERFSRGGRRRSEGAGLGLSIVRAVARAHGGDVAVVSRPGHGSRFTITVPVRAEEEAEWPAS